MTETLRTAASCVVFVLAVVAAGLPWATPAIGVFGSPTGLLLAELAISAVLAWAGHLLQHMGPAQTYGNAAVVGTILTASFMYLMFVAGPGWSS